MTRIRVHSAAGLSGRIIVHRRYTGRRVRCGLSSLEVVMATAVTLPIVVLLFWLCLEACAFLYQMITTLVGWPYL